MRRHSIVILALITVFVTNAAAITGGAAPVTVEANVTGDDITVFAGEDIIQFAAARSGDEVALYRNTSLQEYASWQLADQARDEVLDQIHNQLPSLQDDSLQSGLAAGTIRLTFIRNRSRDEITFEDVVAATPRQIEGTVTINGHMTDATARINVTAVEAIDIAWGAAAEGRSAADTATAYGSFGGETGPQYNTTFEAIRTVPGQHTGDRVSNVTVSSDAIRLTGHIEVPTPCHRLQPAYEERNGTLHLTVTPVPGDGMCMQTIAMKQYRLQVNATEPFTLAVHHGNSSVRAIRTGQQNGPEGDTENFIAQVMDAIAALLPL